MANLAVFASGRGTNFNAIADAVRETDHSLVCLICNRGNAPVFEKAKTRNIPAFLISYAGRSREDAELEMIAFCRTFGVDLIALAGFMRILTPVIIDAFSGRILNIHPSLLPRFPGVDGIKRSYNSHDDYVGITIHQVDHSLDGGPIVLQKSFKRTMAETLEEIEERIHALEHMYYPKVIIDKLDRIDQAQKG